MRARHLDRLDPRSRADAPADERPPARPEPGLLTAHGILELQRAAGNRGVAALLQRMPADVTYAPTAARSMTKAFKTRHLGNTWQRAIDAHGIRGDWPVNTIVEMTDDDAVDEITYVLRNAPATPAVATLSELEFTTRSDYRYHETTLLDNRTGLHRVEYGFGNIMLNMQWQDGAQCFALNHLAGTVNKDEVESFNWQPS